ncbi:hypothetical protein Rs2_35469 [Raphanus sativus]|nr:hypothetical protein Rs2_35469 [Raphanus sativus]
MKTAHRTHSGTNIEIFNRSIEFLLTQPLSLDDLTSLFNQLNLNQKIIRPEEGKFEEFGQKELFEKVNPHEGHAGPEECNKEWPMIPPSQSTHLVFNRSGPAIAKTDIA